VRDHSSEISDCGAVVEPRVNFDGAGSAHHGAELSRMPHLDMGVNIISSSQMGTTTRLLRGTERRLHAGHCEQHPIVDAMV
jgi:hypothetical protein